MLQSCGMGETAMQAKARLYLRCVLPPGMQHEALYLPAGQNGGMRLVQPSLPWTVVRYRMLCTNGNATVTRDFSRQSIDLVLEPGLWTITVEGLSASDALIVTATKEIELLPGRTSSTALQLHMAEGKGTASILLQPSLSLPESWSYAVELVYEGLPGKSDLPSVPPLTTIIPSTAPRFECADLDAGYYTFAISLLDQTGAVIAGAADSLVILPGQTSIGSCALQIQQPSINFSCTLPALSLVARGAASVPRTVTDRWSIEFASLTERSDLQASWRINGSRLDQTAVGIGTVLGGCTLQIAKLPEPANIAQVRADVMLKDVENSVLGAFSSQLLMDRPWEQGMVQWLQQFTAQSALAPSMHDPPGTANQGTGIACPVKALAGSGDGTLIAAGGMDQSSAIHVFFAPAGTQLVDATGRSFTASAAAGWIRLWRDRVVIDGTEKTVDRLAVSRDGSRIAAAGSASTWVRIHTLSATGALLSKVDIIAGRDGMPSFGSIRALKFSEDGTLLYVLSNSPEKLMVFNLSDASGSPRLQTEFLFSSCFDPPPSTSLGMESLELLPDGTIAACSSNIPRLFLLRREGTSLIHEQVVSSGENGQSLGDPKSLIWDASAEVLHVLGYSKKLHALTRDPATGTWKIRTISLPAALDKARTMALLEDQQTCEKALCIAGSGGLGIALLNQGYPMTPVIFEPGDTDRFGICTASGLIPQHGACAMAGGESGSISVFAFKVLK